MLHPDATGLLAGAVLLGAIHGIEPGHGWPVAASYALDRSRPVLYGLLAGLVIGVGHLVSSLAMVGAFFYAKSYVGLEQVNEPITVLEGVQIGGPVSLVAGVLLIALGIREARYGHPHGSRGHDHGGHHGHDNDGHHRLDHGHDDLDHDQDHPDSDHRDHHQHGHDDHGHHENSGGGLLGRLRSVLPGSGGHSHGHATPESGADRGLFGIAWFAFVLGFAHEEEFEIIALCAGSTYCLELMVAYALTVIVGILGLTMLLIAGYQHAEERVERFTPYLPAFSAAVLVVMGLGFVLGLF